MLEYVKLSATDKLRWLEEINEFIRLAETPESAKARKLFEAKNIKKSEYPPE